VEIPEGRSVDFRGLLDLVDMREDKGREYFNTHELMRDIAIDLFREKEKSESQELEGRGGPLPDS
jgi:hypothetical protein